MKLLICSILIISSFYGFPQTTPQQEIDQQVWRPFTEVVKTQNVSAFMALHSRDVVRAEIDSKKVLGYEQYKNEMEQSWPKWKEAIKNNKLDYAFELRFTNRIANKDVAYEIGYFKSETTNADGDKKIGYGKFHVVLRKENGTWKILVDSDSKEGGNITEEMFQNASPLSL